MENSSMDDWGVPHDLGNLHIIYTLELLFDNFWVGPSGIKHGVIWEPGCFTCRRQNITKKSQAPQVHLRVYTTNSQKIGKIPSRYARMIFPSNHRGCSVLMPLQMWPRCDLG